MITFVKPPCPDSHGHSPSFIRTKGVTLRCLTFEYRPSLDPIPLEPFLQRNALPCLFSKPAPIIEFLQPGSVLFFAYLRPPPFQCLFPLPPCSAPFPLICPLPGFLACCTSLSSPPPPPTPAIIRKRCPFPLSTWEIFLTLGLVLWVFHSAAAFFPPPQKSVTSLPFPPSME